jgi:drug/metabolite transporter (DMT)-like permease
VRAGEAHPRVVSFWKAGAGLGVSLTAISWAAILIVLSVSEPVVVAFSRLALAVVLLLPALLLPSVRRDLKHIRKILLPAFLSGALLALHLLLWIASLRVTTVAASMFLLSSQALFALVLSHLVLREPVSLRGWAAVGLGTIGACLIATGDVTGGRGLTGAVLAVLSALAFVFYLAAGRVGRRHVGNLTWILVAYSFASLTLAPFLLFARWPASGEVRRELLIFLALAAGPTILGHGFMNYALRFVRIHVVNLTVLSEPFLTILWARLLLDEKLGPWTWPGGLLLIGGCVVAVIEEKREQFGTAADRTRQEKTGPVSRARSESEV